MANQIEKLADAIINDIYGSLKGYHTNLSISKEQLMEEVVEERLLIMRELTMKGNLPLLELLVSINCIPVDCKSITKCPCYSDDIGCAEPSAHFEIPQLMLDLGIDSAILYVGSSDRRHPFIVYTQPLDRVTSLQKYRKRGKDRPYVYIDLSPNENGMLDGFIFGAPLIKQISVTAIFKDLRLLEQYSCCADLEEGNSFLNSMIKERLTKKKILYYRSYAPLNKPNDLLYE